MAKLPNSLSLHADVKQQISLMATQFELMGIS